MTGQVENLKEAAEAEADASNAEAIAEKAKADAVVSTAAAAQGAAAAAEAGAALAKASAAEAEAEAAEKITQTEEKWAHLGSQMEMLHQRTQTLEAGLNGLTTALPEMMTKMETNLKTLLTPAKSDGQEVNPETTNRNGVADGHLKTEADKPNNQNQKPSRTVRRL
jgi:chaperonin cofactor prefoldin